MQRSSGNLISMVALVNKNECVFSRISSIILLSTLSFCPRYVNHMSQCHFDANLIYFLHRLGIPVLIYRKPLALSKSPPIMVPVVKKLNGWGAFCVPNEEMTKASMLSSTLWSPAILKKCTTQQSGNSF